MEGKGREGSKEVRGGTLFGSLDFINAMNVAKLLAINGQDRRGQGRRGQGRTGQERTGQDRTGQDRARQEMLTAHPILINTLEEGYHAQKVRRTPRKVNLQLQCNISTVRRTQ
jgi:hypothetical protein